MLELEYGSTNMASLTIFHARDGEGWFNYVKSILEDDIHIESLNLDTDDWNDAKKSGSLLIILTPGLVDRVVTEQNEFLHVHNVVADPSHTFGLYCGCEESDISDVQWDGFDRWTFSSLGSGEPDVIKNAVGSIKNFVISPVPGKGMNDNHMANVLKEMQNKKKKRKDDAVKSKTETNSTTSVPVPTDGDEGQSVGATAEGSSELQPSSRTESPQPPKEDSMNTTFSTSGSVRGIAQLLQSQLNPPGWKQNPSTRKPVDPVPEDVRKLPPPKPPVKPKTKTKSVQMAPQSCQSSVTVDKPKPPVKPPKEVKRDQIADTDSKPEETERLPPRTPPKPSSCHTALPPNPGASEQPVEKERTDACDEKEVTMDMMDTISSARAKVSEKKWIKLPEGATDAIRSTTCRAKESEKNRSKSPEGATDVISSTRAKESEKKRTKSPEWSTGAISSTGAKESEKKSKQFRIFPSNVQYNDEILIILSEPSTEPQLAVKIQNRKKDQRDGKSALRVNDYTYSFTFDCVDMSPGTLHLTVFEQKTTCLGSQKIKYRSNLDMINEILPTLATPIEMMCDVLNLDSANTAALDQHFTRSYHEHSPRQSGPFYNFASENIAERSDKVLPTLLHLAAKFGLMEFAKLLITFPSASVAYRIDNRDGLSPKDIAEKENHPDLIKFFEKYEIAIMDYETNLIYEDMMTAHTTGTTINNSSGITEEDIYLSMESHYHPKYPVASAQKQQSNYDYYRGPDGQQKCLKLVMKHDEESNSDEGPGLRTPIDEFAQGRTRSNSIDSSDAADYLDMTMSDMPTKPPSGYDDDDHDDDDDYIDGDLSGMRDAQVMQTGRVQKRRPLPPPPPPMHTGSGTSRMPSSAQSLLDAPAEEENPYTDQSTSMSELVLIQRECKEGMFSHEETLTRFEHWKAKFDTGTSKSLKSRMGKLQRIRQFFADKLSKGDEIDIALMVDINKLPKVSEPKTKTRAPEPLPRVDVGPVSVRHPSPNQKQRTYSSRSASTLSSGSSRTSNLSMQSVCDSGNVTEEIYEEYGSEHSTLTDISQASSIPNIYTASPPTQEGSPPPPLPPRLESRFPRPLPNPPPSSVHPMWHNTNPDDDDDEIKGLPPAPRVPPLPPRKY